jgi:hypothetical protein
MSTTLSMTIERVFNFSQDCVGKLAADFRSNSGGSTDVREQHVAK